MDPPPLHGSGSISSSFQGYHSLPLILLHLIASQRMQHDPGFRTSVAIAVVRAKRARDQQWRQEAQSSKDVNSGLVQLVLKLLQQGGPLEGALSKQAVEQRLLQVGEGHRLSMESSSMKPGTSRSGASNHGLKSWQTGKWSIVEPNAQARL